MRIAILHEHPDWNEPLFGEMSRRGLEWISVDASKPEFDPTHVGDWDVLVNRMSPSAWTRGHMSAMLQTPELLRSVESTGIPVINGREAFAYELSKRRQLEMFRRERVRHPEGRPFLNQTEIMGAAVDLDFPVLVKPNIGGSGAGIVEFSAWEQLEAAVEAGFGESLGPDGTGLVQEKLPARGNSVVRVEVLDAKFLYGIRLRLMPGSFNLCPADYCEPGVEGSGDLIERYTPPSHLIEEAVRIVDVVGADLGGVEYLINDLDGQAYFYDVNVLSNFVADPVRVVGFDPFARLVDFIEGRARRSVMH